MHPTAPTLERATTQLDDLVRDEASRLRAGLDTERQGLREALLRAARDVVTAGDEAAAALVSKGLDVGTAFAARDEEARAARVELAARVAHDRVRAAAMRLADELRAMEGDLAAPLARASRRVLGEGLPAVRRAVNESAAEAAAALGDDPAPDAVAALEVRLEGWLGEARAGARAQVDDALARIRAATARGVEAVEGAVDELPARVRAAVDTTVEPRLRALGDEVALPRRGWVAATAWAGATALALLLVVATTLLAYGVGLAVALGLFGAIVLTGTYAPPVGAGFVAAAIGTLLAAAVTDFLFNVLGDWREGRDDGLLGAAVPYRSGGRLPRSLELGPVLEALRLSPPRPELLPGRRAADDEG
jgi:hypothetical protein